MPRYVILEHDHPELHWDLMLETGDVLRTWRLAEPPRADKTATAEMSFDHRLKYLDYEGPISDNRGSVQRWDNGDYSGDLSNLDSATGIKLFVRGAKLDGQIVLTRMTDAMWSVEYLPDV